MKGKKYYNMATDRNRIKVFNLFILLSIYRIGLTWMLRTQFDPDEYWQTLEPAYCLAFSNQTTTASLPMLLPQQKYGCALTWEWTRRKTAPPQTKVIEITTSQNFIHSVEAAVEEALQGPVRSYVSILPTYWYYIGCRSMFQWATNNDDDSGNITKRSSSSGWNGLVTKLAAHTRQNVRQKSTYLISKGPAFLHAVTVAVPTDLSVWLLASRLERLGNNSANRAAHLDWRPSWATWALILTVTSWFNGYALVRTYANSTEAMFLMVGITLLSPELFDNASRRRHRSYRYRPQARIAFVLGGLSACVRFTSLAAWIPIGVAIVMRESGTAKRKLATLLELCAANGLLGVILGCCVDRWMYGFWAIPFLGNFHFNAILGLGSLYGTHPMLWYVYAGIPAICGIALPFFLWEALLLLSRREDRSITSRLTICWIVASYTILHSFSAHKEFRFLLPILPLMFVLAGHAMKQLFDDISIGYYILIIASLCLLNYPHLIFLGTIHQRGPISANALLASLMNDDAHRAKSSGQYSIKYLMGCHSAPAYSHLHTIDAIVDIEYLDCSPQCRSSNDVICESDAFLKDPYNFMQSRYFTKAENKCKMEDGIDNPSCPNDHSKVPSFVVIMNNDAIKIDSLLKDYWNATRIASLRHSISSISWHKGTANDNNALSLLPWVDIHFDQILIYSTV